MAVTEEADKQQCTIKINNGRDSAGNVKTVNQNLGSLAVNGWDAQKAVNIVNALTPLFSSGVHAITHTVTNVLIEE